MYEIFVMTENGAIVGSFDSYEEANNFFKWAKTQKHDIVTRLNNYGKVIKEKRLIADEPAYESGLLPSIESLRNAISHIQKEQFDLEERIHKLINSYSQK